MSDEDRRPHEIVRLRLSPTLRRDVATYQETAGLKNTSEALRNLITEGVNAQDGPQFRSKPRLSRPQYAERAAGLVDALGDLLQQVERHDPQGALLLCQGMLKAMDQYHRDLTDRTAQ